MMAEEMAWKGLPASYQFGTLTRDRVPSGAGWLKSYINHHQHSTTHRHRNTKMAHWLVLMMPTLKFYRRAHKSFLQKKYAKKQTRQVSF